MRRNPSPESLEALRKEVERELALRRNVYPGWVKAGKLKPEVAASRIECMESLLALVKDRIELSNTFTDVAIVFRPLAGPQPQQQQLI